MLIIINEVVEILQQEVRILKTKYKRVIRREVEVEDKVDLKIKVERVEEVSDFKYLLVHESNDGKMNVMHESMKI